MGKTGVKTAVFGLTVNFVLFLIKLYVSISSGSLAIYCDGINNLGDTFSCIIALVGFALAIRLNEKKQPCTVPCIICNRADFSIHRCIFCI